VEEAVAKSLKGEAFHDPSEAEKGIFSKHAPKHVPLIFEPSIVDDSPPPPNPQWSNEKPSTLDVRFQGNDGYLIAKSKSSGEVYLKLKLSEVNQLPSDLLIRQDEIGNIKKTFELYKGQKDLWYLIVYDNLNKQTYRVLCSSRYEAERVERITSVAFQLDPRYIPIESKDWKLHWRQPRLNQYVFAECEKLTLSGYNVGKPAVVNGGVLIEYKEPSPPGQVGQRFWWINEIGGARNFCKVYAFGANAETGLLTMKTCKAISAWSPPYRTLFFIAQDSPDPNESSPRVAMLRLDAGAPMLYVDALNSSETVPVKFVKFSFDDFDLLAAAVRSSWRGELEMGDVTIYVGRAGLVVVREDSISLLSNARLREQKGELSLIVLTREQITQWSSDTDRLLPRKYSTEKIRHSLDLKHLAEEAIQPWSGNRKTKDDWQASPIGLLEALGAKP